MAHPRYLRTLDLAPWLRHTSAFLIGPRQTGKSTLLRDRFPDAHFIDLLESDTFRAYSTAPERLRETVEPERLVVIDEVQKLPGLLDEVQAIIDRTGTRFVLTGSSARKLRRGRANLLAGRALFFDLHPLTSHEIGIERIDTLLRIGGLPGVVDSPIAWEELKAYVGAYLKEEIQAEALTRSIENFARFLDVCAHFNATRINYTKIGNDAQVPPRTVRDYVEVLKDTLVLHVLPPYAHHSRKLTAADKVYFFDIGVAHALAGRAAPVEPGTPEFGAVFEHLLFLELRAALDYARRDEPLTYWQTRTGREVDFVIADAVGIECKGTGRVGPADLKGIRSLAREVPLARKLIVCRERERRVTDDGIEIVPLEAFCTELWSGGLWT